VRVVGDEERAIVDDTQIISVPVPVRRPLRNGGASMRLKVEERACMNF
jgi:hypothetical protein